MANYNKVMLMGNMTRDPQLKYLPSQTPLVEFGLAVNRRYTVNGEQREETCFVDCTAFGKPAEIINQYCQKGKSIFIEGRLKFDSWEDKQGGGKRSKLSVVVDNFQFLGGPGQGGGGGGGGGQHDEYDQRPQSRAPQQRGPAAGGRPAQRPPQQQEEPPFSDEAQFKEDDIPF